MGWTFFNASGNPSEILTREFTQVPSEKYPSAFKVIDRYWPNPSIHRLIQAV